MHVFDSVRSDVADDFDARQLQHHVEGVQHPWWNCGHRHNRHNDLWSDSEWLFSRHPSVPYVDEAVLPSHLLRLSIHLHFRIGHQLHPIIHPLHFRSDVVTFPALQRHSKTIPLKVPHFRTDLPPSDHNGSDWDLHFGEFHQTRRALNTVQNRKCRSNRVAVRGCVRQRIPHLCLL